MFVYVVYEGGSILIEIVVEDNLDLVESKVKRLILCCFLVCKCCSCLGIFYY